MPPQQPFLASGTRGYICRSCISKLQKSYQPRSSWLARKITNDNRPRRSNTTPKPVIKYWEQNGDGQRRENQFQDAAFLEKVERSIKELGDDIGDQRLQEDLQELEEVDAEDKSWEEQEEEQGLEDAYEEYINKSMGVSNDVQSKTDAIYAQMEALDGQMRRLEDNPELENLSAEDRLRIRREALDGIPGINVEATPSIQDNQSPPTADSRNLTVIPPLKNYGDFPAPLVAEEFPVHNRSSFERLNSSLRLCSRSLKENKLSDVAQKSAWESYVLCRRYLMGAPEKVPNEIWSLLWNIFQQPGVKNFGRMEHIYRLGEDMKKARIPFQPHQHVLFIESKYIGGYQEAAIKEWEEAEDSLGKNKLSFKDYWELGVRMYAQSGDGEKALDAVASYIAESNQPVDFRLLIPVIRGFLAMQTQDSQTRAWRVYEALRSNLGSEMTMQDFDNVTALFMDADLPERALDIFKDMMLAGDRPRRKSIAQDLADGKRVPLDLVEKVRVGLDLENSQTLATLPSHFNNKFFFGKWIKKLIGEGHLDAAKKVLDLMGVRGICPDAKYLNGLIGAFYRDGPLGKQQLAEDLAWKMIASRLEFVKAREMTYQLDAHIRTSEGNAKPDSKAPFLIPHATIETFSILMEQYRRRQKQDIILDLLNTLRKAKIPPNTYFMNQLIMANARSHQGAWAWDTYSSLVYKQGVRPDFDTFTYLWDLMRRASDPVTRSQGTGYTDCRTLFSEMAKHSKVLCRKESMPREVYDMSILAFSLSNDQAGTAVALRALQRRFNMFPDENTARTIILQLAKVGLLDQNGRPVKRLGTKKSRTKNRIIKVTQVLATFKQRRVESLLEQGIVFEELTNEEKMEQSLTLLTDLLKFVALERLGSGMHKGGIETAEDLSKEAAAKMGVQDCDPWEVVTENGDH